MFQLRIKTSSHSASNRHSLLPDGLHPKGSNASPVASCELTECPERV